MKLIQIEFVYFSREMFITVHHVFKKDKNQDFKIHIELINSSCILLFYNMCMNVFACMCIMCISDACIGSHGIRLKID